MRVREDEGQSEGREMSGLAAQMTTSVLFGMYIESPLHYNFITNFLTLNSSYIAWGRVITICKEQVSNILDPQHLLVHACTVMAQ